jgi:hypothetical protein
VRTWLQRLALMGIGLVAGLVLVEVGLQLRERLVGAANTAPDFEGAVFAFCPSRHHCLVPNGRYRHTSAEFDYRWTNNALGMRDRERQWQKAPGAFRILVLGDSMVQGHGVALEDSMAWQLEEHLRRRYPRVEVLNGGIFGYSPLLEYLYLREIIDRVQPDVVIVALFLDNDVGEDHWYAGKAHFAPDGATATFDDREWPWSAILTALAGGDPSAPPPAGQGGTGGPDVRGLLRRSRVLMTVNRWLKAADYPREREREFALVRAHRGDIRYDLGFVNYPVLTREARLEYWKASAGWLGRMADLCRAHGLPMLLLVIPPVGRLDGTTAFAEPYEVSAEIGERLQVPVIQLLPDFLEHGHPYDLYYRWDRHWTPEGNRLAAGVVERELDRLAVLPPTP